MNQLSARLRASLWWLVPLAAIAILIGWETDWGRAVETYPPAPEAIAPKPVVTALLPEYAIEGGVAARAETVQRTLFNPTRRPAPTLAQDGAGAQMQRGQFALTGTTLVEGKNTAFLREVAGNKSRRVQAGETINGLLVAEVKPDRVRLTQGGESEELVLKVATNPRPTPQPAVAGAPTAPAAGTPVRAAVPPPAPAVAQDAAQTLAERRRAARAAAAGQQPASPPAPNTAVAAPAAAPAGAPAPVDPRWEQMDQRYRQPVPGRANVQ